MSQWQRFLASPVDLDFHSPMDELFDFGDTDRATTAEHGIDAIQMRRAVICPFAILPCMSSFCVFAVITLEPSGSMF